MSTKEKRRDLRNNMTEAEKLLWLELKNDKLGHRFRRQFSIGYYIVDFYCPRKKLVIELDGEVHTNQIEYDCLRDKFMREFELVVLRFKNHDIKTNLNDVLNEIKKHLSSG
jgi:very-short-patch-repair endonuclease